MKDTSKHCIVRYIFGIYHLVNVTGAGSICEEIVYKIVTCTFIASIFCTKYCRHVFKKKLMLKGSLADAGEARGCSTNTFVNN